MKRILLSISIFIFVILVLAIRIATAVSVEQTIAGPASLAEVVPLLAESIRGLETMRLDRDDDYLHSVPLSPDPGDYPAERAALMSLYESTDGGSWFENGGWGGSGSYCTWFGVSCDGAGHVLHLNLDNNWLMGPIPPAIDNLVELQTLNLSGNVLYGPIPEELGNLAQLQHLDLSDNVICIKGCGRTLGGAIPASLGNLTNLQTLDLSRNRLEGAIPAELGDLAQLQTLDLSYNYFCWPAILPSDKVICPGGLFGTIPAELSGLSALQALSLQGNKSLCWETVMAKNWALTLPHYSGPTDCSYISIILASD